MKFLAAVAATIGVVAASDFGSWSLYCGSSCSGGTLINTGSLDTNTITTCTNLGATYDYCHLEVEKYPNLYRATVAPSADCTSYSTSNIISAGGCSPAGNWQYYRIYYTA
ncbi:hypothetical protein BGW36DRAFT_355935 [Talaromyces proteolyticus]|uniref:Cyanovirin-N domain-containing protein n=1 Tax=Talaromyces proteolyticus TaxID=1131652 RepID=A0AAD4Q3I6_9EURO|nr:uncharacterized protein BGW36DRAFT_355935 [Talaromyces proteolyticus]KAH8701782.1 hypothetical protein BGW36DRAFT_355935 [Talaromyces proteolyticus]